jgi:3-phenylpropionate/trans-cinnamate dioxygenase ferredoxin reductase subunit
VLSATKQVTIIEALPRLLAQVAGDTISTFYPEAHRAHGVNVLSDEAVVGLIGAGGRVSGVELSDDRIVACDLVIVGIGIFANVGPLGDSGATVTGGVWVDDSGRTTLPDVYAVGDCALRSSVFSSTGAR